MQVLAAASHLASELGYKLAVMTKPMSPKASAARASAQTKRSASASVKSARAAARAQMMAEGRDGREDVIPDEAEILMPANMKQEE